MKEHNSNENTYVKKISYKPNSPLKPIRTYAIEHHVPIIGDEVLNFLGLLLSLKKPKHILEVGTAIGYSASFMLLNSSADLVSIEKSKDSYDIAIQNLRKMEVENRARLILGDASEVLKEMRQKEDNKYDFVFIDASKAHYLEHLKLVEPMLEEEAIIVFDNVLYLGLVAGRRSISRNKTIRNRMQALMDYVFHNEKYKASLLQSEDGLLIVYKIKA